MLYAAHTIDFLKGEEAMRICILMGSPRKNGNTAGLLRPFMEEMERNGCECSLVWLYDKSIHPCYACRTCQNDWSGFGCPQEDDMQEIFDRVLHCELLVLATPIYAWYCTAPMKAAMDRLVYGMNKYYGEEKGPSIWEGKKVALIATCGYRPEKGADLWEQGVIRYCKHSGLQYMGMLVERDLGYESVFMDEEKALHARQFADRLAMP